MADFPIKTTEQLGAILRGFRRERKLTQKAVGARTGLAQNAISQLETNPGPASFAKVLRVLSALDVDIVIRHREKPDNSGEW
jgi:HTH-type transcriptional regulator/antitoxin HipB